MVTKTYLTFEGPKLARIIGRCVVCRNELYVFSDGSSGDPRGAIKEHNNYDPFIAEEYSMVGPDIPACFACCNKQETYNRGLELAKRQWHKSEVA